MFHSLKGCDTVSKFICCTKKTCLDVWNVFPELTDALLELNLCPDDVPHQVLDIIQIYVVILYDRTSEALCVNDARRIMNCKGGKSMDSILPTTNALLQHIKQGAFI